MAASPVPTEHVLFSKRAEWSDLTPIPQADAPNALVPIAYAPEYRDAMDYFRALVATREKSARGLDLTELIIRFNPGHYSIWAYRAEILMKLRETEGDKVLETELDLLDELVKFHLKSYQVWQHRRTIVLALNDSSREIAFTTRALTLDSKNYHTWAYRQWILCHFFTPSAKFPDEWAREFRYAEELLEEDVRNNSAWNHRFFLSFEVDTMQADVKDRELNYSKLKLALSPNNPSAWNYLRGVLTRTATPFTTLLPFVLPLTAPLPETPLIADGVTISEDAELPAFLAIEFVADTALIEARGLFLHAAKGEKEKEELDEKTAEAAALFNSLVQYDPIRTKYWHHRAKESLKLIQP